MTLRKYRFKLRSILGFSLARIQLCKVEQFFNFLAIYPKDQIHNKTSRLLKNFPKTYGHQFHPIVDYVWKFPDTTKRYFG